MGNAIAQWMVQQYPLLEAAMGKAGNYLEAQRKVDASVKALEVMKVSMKALEAAVDSGKKEDRGVHTKGAAHLKPSAWTNVAEVPWRTFAAGVRNWAVAVSPRLRELMLVAERSTEEKMENTMKCLKGNSGKEGKYEAYDPDDAKDGAMYAALDEVLYQNPHTLIKTTEGETFVTAHEGDRSGLNAWKEMAKHFDPAAAEDRSIEHARVTRPEQWLGRAKSTSEARMHLEKWQTERRRYEAKYTTKVDPMDLLVALKSLMPESMFGDQGCFRGQKHIGFEELMKKVVAYIDDKPISLNAALMTRKSNTNNMEDQKEEEHEGEGEDGKKYSYDDLMMMMGKGAKGSGMKGKGKGKRRQCHKCGSEDH